VIRAVLRTAISPVIVGNAAVLHAAVDIGSSLVVICASVVDTTVKGRVVSTGVVGRFVVTIAVGVTVVSPIVVGNAGVLYTAVDIGSWLVVICASDVDTTSMSTMVTIEVVGGSVVTITVGVRVVSPIVVGNAGVLPTAVYIGSSLVVICASVVDITVMGTVVSIGVVGGSVVIITVGITVVSPIVAGNGAVRPNAVDIGSSLMVICEPVVDTTVMGTLVLL